jgi:hypothetical protein
MASGMSGQVEPRYNSRKMVVITIFGLLLCLPLGIVGLLLFLHADDLKHREGRTAEETAKIPKVDARIRSVQKVVGDSKEIKLLKK